jgi:hypothetical protein
MQCSKFAAYSITSVACARRLRGTSRPSDLRCETLEPLMSQLGHGGTNSPRAQVVRNTSVNGLSDGRASGLLSATTRLVRCSKLQPIR